MMDEGAQAHIDTLAAQVRALTAERDQWKFRASVRSDLAPTYLEERDAARAELAAANDRIEEQRQDLMRRDSATYARMQERDALQATLDRVTAGPALYLIRNSKTGEWFMGSVGGDDGIWAKNIAMSVVYSSQTGPRSGLPEGGEWVEFRAALTPEGKE